MDQEKWDELMKLREKASLNPKTDYRFEQLENYLSDLHTSNLFLQRDHQRFRDQLNKLSEQEKQDILSRAENKTMVNFFHLTYDEVEKLQTARKELSFHERARLLSNLTLTLAGTAWLDLGEVFEAQIEIDDSSSPERWFRPYAYISFSNVSYRRVETVDILESVKNNPASIGHPAIAFAIYHWQRVIYAKRVIERDDITSRDEEYRAFKRVFSGELEVEIAERNLKVIGNNLLKGAKKSAISKESALALKMESLGLRLEDTNTVIYQAWERLSAEFIDPTDEVEQVLAKLETGLRAFEKQPYTNSNSRRISADRVMEFLRAEGDKGGKKFVGNNEEGVSLRQQWKVFRNAFAAWFFDLDQKNTVQDYLEKAAKDDIAEDDIFQYSWITPKSRVSAVFYYLATNQLAMAREPITIHESDIGSLGIAKAIERITSQEREDEDSN
jgi:hypothetical protein